MSPVYFYVTICYHIFQKEIYFFFGLGIQTQVGMSKLKSHSVERSNEVKDYSSTDNIFKDLAVK